MTRDYVDLFGRAQGYADLARSLVIIAKGAVSCGDKGKALNALSDICRYLKLTGTLHHEPCPVCKSMSRCYDGECIYCPDCYDGAPDAKPQAIILNENEQDAWREWDAMCEEWTQHELDE